MGNYLKDVGKPCKLHRRTLELLRNDKRGINTIFLESKIPPDWLRLFRSGGIPQASANRIVRLYEFLSGKPVLGNVFYTDFSKPCELYKTTLKLFKKDRRNIPAISRESGIPEDWLRFVIAGKIKKSSVNRIVKLYEFLSGKELIIE